MKNERYLEKAVAKLREDKHLPERALALSDDDLIAITQSVYNVCQELAVENGSTIELVFPDDEELAFFRLAHERDITFTELIEQAVERMIDEHGKNSEK